MIPMTNPHGIGMTIRQYAAEKARTENQKKAEPMTLLEKAQAVNHIRRRKPKDDPLFIEKCALAVAVLTGEISTKQASVALDVESHNANNAVLSILGRGIRAGVIEVKMADLPLERETKL